jgi:predicted ester cyclase
MPTAIERNKALVRRIYEELWNQGKLAVADEIFARSPSVKDYVSQFLSAFPDLEHTVQEMVAEGDTVVAAFSAKGTHTRPWHGIAPTHKQISYSGITIAHIEGAKIVEHRTTWDTLTVLEQLGVVPAVRKADGTKL